jgi:DNA modification methylase
LGDYDPADNAAKSYDMAIEALREKLASFRCERIGDCTLYLGDSGLLLPLLPRADAVVTDPPYGIGEAAGKNKSRDNMAGAKDYGDAEWDDQPISKELIGRVLAAGKWQIIFGGNYYDMPASSCWLVWDKLNTGDFADCELAWTNLPKAVRRIKFLWNGMIRREKDVERVHPTQKPVEVMKWCIGHLPEPSRTIIDPFMGSGTTGVAAVRMGRKFIGIEMDEGYFNAACLRIAGAYAQPDMFVEAEPKAKQMDMLG